MPPYCTRYTGLFLKKLSLTSVWYGESSFEMWDWWRQRPQDQRLSFPARENDPPTWIVLLMGIMHSSPWNYCKSATRGKEKPSGIPCNLCSDWGCSGRRLWGHCQGTSPGWPRTADGVFQISWHSLAAFLVSQDRKSAKVGVQKSFWLLGLFLTLALSYFSHQYCKTPISPLL